MSNLKNIILLAGLCFLLTACNNEDEETSITGKWSISATTEIYDNGDFIASIPHPYTEVILDEDGTGTLTPGSNGQENTSFQWYIYSEEALMQVIYTLPTPDGPVFERNRFFVTKSNGGIKLEKTIRSTVSSGITREETETWELSR